MGSEAEEMATMRSKLGLVLAAKSRSLVFTSSTSSNMFASPVHTLASVPFCWEEKPGRPKHHLLSHSYNNKCLELPPRLLLPGERGEGCGAINGNVKITRIDRNSSLYSLSTHRSHFWANIYKGFKQVVQRKSKKLRREGF